LLPRVYEDLRRLAAQRMSREAAGQTLQLLRYTGAGVTLKGVAARETHLSAIFLPSRVGLDFASLGHAFCLVDLTRVHPPQNIAHALRLKKET
jgi:hypothetical protein